MKITLAMDRSAPPYQALLLGVACAVVSLLLMLGHQATSTTILKLQEEDKRALLAQVLPAEHYDNQPLRDTVNIAAPELSAPATLMLAKKEGVLSAGVLQLSTAGWGGEMQLLIAIKPDGTLMGVRIVHHKETPGLADGIEIDKSDWIKSFDGKSLKNPSKIGWAVKKDGGEFDQFTGATITPRAVVRSVYLGLQLFQQWQQQQSNNQEK